MKIRRNLRASVQSKIRQSSGPGSNKKGDPSPGTSRPHRSPLQARRAWGLLPTPYRPPVPEGALWVGEPDVGFSRCAESDAPLGHFLLYTQNRGLSRTQMPDYVRHFSCVPDTSQSAWHGNPLSPGHQPGRQRPVEIIPLPHPGETGRRDRPPGGPPAHRRGGLPHPGRGDRRTGETFPRPFCPTALSARALRPARAPFRPQTGLSAAGGMPLSSGGPTARG